MADIVLKDRNGKDIQYPGINHLKVKTVNGETKNFVARNPVETTVNLDFSDGDMVVTPNAEELFNRVNIPVPETLIPENIVEGVTVCGVAGEAVVPESVETTIDPDFSDGDMTVTPETGKVFSKTTVKAPANLIPKNVAEGVDIAGIIGTLATGGDVKVTGGTFKGVRQETTTIEHGLGVTPDIVYVGTGSVSDSTAYTFMNCINVSRALVEKINWGSRTGLKSAHWKSSASSSYYTVDTANGLTVALDEPSGNYLNSLLCNANANTFDIWSPAYQPMPDKTYYWIAVGGLT